MYPNFASLPGIRLISAPAEIQLDIFLDLQCPYSSSSWNTIGKPFTEKWGKIFNIYLHFITLSHHRQSWDLTRTLFAIRRLNEDKTVNFIDLVYSEQDQFYNANWKSRSEVEFLDYLANVASNVIDHPEKELLEIIESDDVYADAKRSIHYASVKQVWSTPTFFINHVPCEALSSSSSIQDWERILSELRQAL